MYLPYSLQNVMFTEIAFDQATVKTSDIKLNFVN